MADAPAGIPLGPSGGPVIRWHGTGFATAFENAMYRGLRKAAAYGRTLVVREISTSARVGGGGRRRPGRGKAGPGKPMQFQRSKPGQPPRRDTGKLAQGIFDTGDRQQMFSAVCTNHKYGVYLELGANVPDRWATRKMFMVWGYEGKWVWKRHARGFRLEPRPYLHSTIVANRSKLMALIASEAKTWVGGSVEIG